MKVCKYNDTLALRCFLSLDQIFQIFLSSLNSFEAVPATQSTFKICPVAWSKKSIPHSTWTIFFKCICIRGAWFYRSIFEALGVEYIFSRITTLNSASFFGRASVAQIWRVVNRPVGRGHWSLPHTVPTKVQTFGTQG